MDIGSLDRACPCGGASYDGCCAPLHRGERQAQTPEELMRSRFTAYAMGLDDYVFRTWHPRTRPEGVAPDPSTRWTALEILDTDGDVVEFRAHFEERGRRGVLQERSRFSERAGRWFYLDGDVVLGPGGATSP